MRRRDCPGAIDRDPRRRRCPTWGGDYSGAIDLRTDVFVLKLASLATISGAVIDPVSLHASGDALGGQYHWSIYGVRLSPIDADGDGHDDRVDNCPLASNEDQANVDGDSQGDACDGCPLDAQNDADGDGRCSDVDNCPRTGNPDQSDLDRDGSGDACDEDTDGDEAADVSEPMFCLLSPTGEPKTARGCAVPSQVCPCAAPHGRVGWNRTTEYRHCVKEAASELQTAGRITSRERGVILKAARVAACGTAP